MALKTDDNAKDTRRRLRFSIIPGQFSICRLDGSEITPEWALRPAIFSSITRTADELSIVCPSTQVPPTAKAESGWVCLKLEGPFPFSMTGVLASFIDPLSANGIPIFAVATFDTDYVLIKEEFWPRARATLQAAGHELASN